MVLVSTGREFENLVPTVRNDWGTGNRERGTGSAERGTDNCRERKEERRPQLEARWLATQHDKGGGGFCWRAQVICF
ncbi:MAG: hypothetical protein ACRC62_14445 [Microcoleus sp.]